MVRLHPEHPVPEDPEQGPENHDFGELMLKSGELLYKKHVVVEDELDSYANIAAEFLPTFEITSQTDPLFSFLRFYIWLTKIIPRIPTNLVKFDPETEFKKLFPFAIAPRMPSSSRLLLCTQLRSVKTRQMTNPLMPR